MWILVEMMQDAHMPYLFCTKGAKSLRTHIAFGEAKREATAWRVRLVAQATPFSCVDLMMSRYFSRT